MRFVIPFLCLCFVFSCQKSKSKEQANSDTATSLSGVPDFDKFYYRFHADSIFQVKSIQFPLQGIPANAGELEIDESSFRWKEEDWTFHQLITDPAFESTFQVLDESLITEYIIHKNEKMGMKRRFSKSIDDQWKLIYYASMNPIAIKRN